MISNLNFKKKKKVFDNFDTIYTISNIFFQNFLQIHELMPFATKDVRLSAIVPPGPCAIKINRIMWFAISPEG